MCQKIHQMNQIVVLVQHSSNEIYGLQRWFHWPHLNCGMHDRLQKSVTSRSPGRLSFFVKVSGKLHRKNLSWNQSRKKLVTGSQYRSRIGTGLKKFGTRKVLKFVSISFLGLVIYCLLDWQMMRHNDEAPISQKCSAWLAVTDINQTIHLKKVRCAFEIIFKSLD